MDDTHHVFGGDSEEEQGKEEHGARTFVRDEKKEEEIEGEGRKRFFFSSRRIISSCSPVRMMWHTQRGRCILFSFFLFISDQRGKSRLDHVYLEIEGNQRFQLSPEWGILYGTAFTFR